MSEIKLVSTRSGQVVAQYVTSADGNIVNVAMHLVLRGFVDTAKMQHTYIRRFGRVVTGMCTCTTCRHTCLLRGVDVVDFGMISLQAGTVATKARGVVGRHRGAFARGPSKWVRIG